MCPRDRSLDTAPQSGSVSHTITHRRKDDSLQNSGRQPSSGMAGKLLCILPSDAQMRCSGAWDKTFGPEPTVLHRAKRSGIRTPALAEACAENWYRIAAEVCDAGRFSNCSRQAMVIRLQGLGLLENLSCTRIGQFGGNSKLRS